MADLKKVATDKAPPIVRATTVTRLVHRRGSLLREALCTKGLVRLRSVIPERSTKLVVITFEAQLLSKFAVLVFEFRSRLLQLADIYVYTLALVAGDCSAYPRSAIATHARSKANLLFPTKYRNWPTDHSWYAPA